MNLFRTGCFLKRQGDARKSVTLTDSETIERKSLSGEMAYRHNRARYVTMDFGNSLDFPLYNGCRVRPNFTKLLARNE